MSFIVIIWHKARQIDSLKARTKVIMLFSMLTIIQVFPHGKRTTGKAFIYFHEISDKEKEFKVRK